MWEPGTKRAMSSSALPKQVTHECAYSPLIYTILMGLAATLTFDLCGLFLLMKRVDQRYNDLNRVNSRQSL